jgi:HEAT repeat protein
MRKVLGAVAVGLCVAVAAFGADVGALIKQLKDGDNDARRAAAKALAEAGGDARAAVPALVRALKDKDLFVRRFAAQALGEVGADPKEALVPLRNALNDPRKEVQEAAATALGKLGAPAVGALAAVVKDPNKETEVRRRAVEALGEMGPDARPAVPVLVGTLKAGGGKKKVPGDADIRVEIATALGNIAAPGDKKVLDALTALTDRKQVRDRSLMQAARQAIQKLQKNK